MDPKVATSLRKYELILSFPPSEEEPGTYLSFIDKVFTKYDIKDIQKEDWGVKKVFHVKKYATLHMFYILFSALPDSIEKITKDLNISPNIVKYFLAKK